MSMHAAAGIDRYAIRVLEFNCTVFCNKKGVTVCSRIVPYFATRRGLRCVLELYRILQQGAAVKVSRNAVPGPGPLIWASSVPA